MTSYVALPDPAPFDLASFADLLPVREHIIGEDPDTFDGFHAGMMQSLLPATPYESVIAENLIAIEWELLQHRRMRDAALRNIVRIAICQAVVARLKNAFQEELDEAWEKFEAAGGSEDDWEDPFDFDVKAAKIAGEDLVDRANSRDKVVWEEAYEEISDLGLKPLELMSRAYQSDASDVASHDDKYQELERRRRDVKRDLDALQKARPIDAKIVEG